MSFHILCVESSVYQLLIYIMEMWSENFHHLHSIVLCDRGLEMTVISMMWSKMLVSLRMMIW